MVELLITKGAEVDAGSAHQAHRAAPQAPPKWPHFRSQNQYNSSTTQQPVICKFEENPMS